MNWHPFLLSLQVTGTATALIFLLGLGLALGLARRRFRLQTLVETAILLPLVLPPSVVGYYLLFLLGREGPVVHWLGWNSLFTWGACVVASTVVTGPVAFQASHEGSALIACTTSSTWLGSSSGSSPCSRIT